MSLKVWALSLKEHTCALNLSSCFAVSSGNMRKLYFIRPKICNNMILNNFRSRLERIRQTN